MTKIKFSISSDKNGRRQSSSNLINAVDSADIFVKNLLSGKRIHGVVKCSDKSHKTTTGEIVIK